jgi:TPR repeat protein
MENGEIFRGGEEGEIKRANRLFQSKNYKGALDIYLKFGGRRNCSRVGWMYELGLGTAKDLQKAEYWYRKAVNNGNSVGYYYLARLRHVAGNYTEIRPLLEKADNYPPALYHLGLLYEFGQGARQDPDTAFQYYEKAAEKGHVYAQRRILRKFTSGEYGIWRIPQGYFMLARLLWRAVKLYYKDPSDERVIKMPWT